jgi:DNA-binding transcriptional MerR regulator
MSKHGFHSFQIGELADLVGMSPRTIRYYEEIGLLNSIKRAEGGKRIYTDLDIQRLRFIKRLKHLGLALSEMLELQNIYQIHGTNTEVLHRLLQLLEGHAEKIDERVQNLLRLKKDILDYRVRIRQKLNTAENETKGRRFHARSGYHQRRADTRR